MPPAAGPASKQKSCKCCRCGKGSSAEDITVECLALRTSTSGFRVQGLRLGLQGSGLKDRRSFQLAVLNSQSQPCCRDFQGFSHTFTAGT